MALSNRKFVRLPPDGAGKRVGSFPVLYVEYNSATGQFSEEQDVIGGTSNTSGRILEVLEYTGTTGQLCIQLSPTSYDGVFTVGENLLVNGQVRAIASNAGTEVYYNEVVLVSGDNPTRRQYIDERGAQYTTFADGTPTLDSANRFRVSYPTIIGTYEMVYSSSMGKFSRQLADGATIGYLPSQSAYEVSVTSASGSSAKITSNKYHYYIPGVGMTNMASVVCGDTGKTGNVRRWGMYDDFNGVFWELSGSVLSVVIRSNTSGVPTDTKVVQSVWNVDRVDGSERIEHNLSKFNLDVTKNNIYTIDYQWYGAGKVKFGILGPDGERIAVHTFRNANTLSVPFMSEGTLPYRVENTNLVGTASPSTIKMISATVQADIPDYSDQLPKENFSYSAPLFSVTSSAAWTYLFAGQAGKYLLGKDNRVLATITGASIYSTQPIFLEVMKGGTINNPAWTVVYADTSAEFDLVGTPTGGTPIYSTIIDGVDELDLAGVFDKFRGETIKRKGDLDATPTPYWVRAKLVSGSTPTSIAVAFNWTEYR